MKEDVLESDIVILGHIAKDVIEIDGKSQPALGGAVYYGAIAGSHMGLRISVITKLNKDDFSILEIFKINGINCFAFPSEQTSGLKNIYSSENMEFRTYEPLGFAGLFKKEEIPEIKTTYFVIGPILAGEVDLGLLKYISEKFEEKLCLDIQGFIRVREKDTVNYRNLTQEEKLEILPRVNILKVDQKEAEVLTGKKDIDEALKELIEYGSHEIVLTHEKGISVNANRRIYSFPWKNKSSIGRTGRGDTAFISYLGSRITKSPEESLKFAAALTSLKLESPEPFMLPLNEVENLIKKEY